MHVLRAEKGYIIVGQETDGTVTPDDVGLGGRSARRSRTSSASARSLRPDLVAPGRKQLVGLLTEDPQTVLEEGAQIVADPAQPMPMPMLGHVTSSYWSASCGRSIALALVAGGRSLIGQTLYATTPAGFAQVGVCESGVLRSHGRARPWLRRPHASLAAPPLARDRGRADSHAQDDAVDHPAAGAACALLTAH